MQNIFKIKLPYQLLIKHKFLMALFYGLLPYTFFFTFEPFGLVEFLQQNRLFVFGYSFIAFAYNFVIFLLTDKIYLRDKIWNVTRVITLYLFIVFSISFIYAIYHHLGEKLPYYRALSYYNIVCMVFTITIFPTTMVVLILKLQDNKKQFLELTKKDKISSIEDEVINNQFCIIKSELLKEKDLKLNINNCLYIKSDNNYCHFYYLNKDNIIENTMLRITLKQVENQITNFKILLRCHNSYIVNRNKIIKIEGNSTNRKIKLKQVDFLIPVSRTLKIKRLG